MAQMSGKALAVYLGLTFCFGVIVGYKLKSWRIRYLQTKRDYLTNKIMDTQAKIEAAIA